MSECSHDCSNCSAKCNSREQTSSFLAPMNEHSNIKKVIGIVSGKGGVGKSMVTSLLAVEAQRRGFKVGILDADITGPSIPKSFGVTERAQGSDLGIFPVLTKTGIEIMSVNLLLEDAGAPVVWRGPVIAGTVKQFWTDVVWNELDYLFIDMPPGTGDVPLTVFQSIPLDGIVVVTSPQDLVSMIVEKAVRMAGLMNIPVLGIVENFSYFTCPDCNKKHYIYGESKLNEIAAKFNIPATVQTPINPKLAAGCDAGMAELADTEMLSDFADAIIGK